MKNKIMLIAGAFALAACSPVQVQTAQQDVSAVTAALNGACATYAATAAAINQTPVGSSATAKNIEGYGSGACAAGQATTAIINAELNDPATQAWVENLSADLAKL